MIKLWAECMQIPAMTNADVEVVSQNKKNGIVKRPLSFFISSFVEMTLLLQTNDGRMHRDKKGQARKQECGQMRPPAPTRIA